MTRPILPPRYVNGSLAVLLACKDERAAWYTYSVLKAFAWSEDTLVIDRATMMVLKNLFGIPKQTLYRHLNWLASSPIHAVLRYGSAGGHTQVDFSPSDDVAWDSPIDGTITVPNMRFAYSSSSVKESINLNQSLKEEEDYEEGEGATDIPVCFLSRSKKVALLQLDGKISADELRTAMEMGRVACEKIYDVQVKALKEIK